jgi:hypothetical protein
MGEEVTPLAFGIEERLLGVVRELEVAIYIAAAETHK